MIRGARLNAVGVVALVREIPNPGLHHHAHLINGFSSRDRRPRPTSQLPPQRSRQLTGRDAPHSARRWVRCSQFQSLLSGDIPNLRNHQIDKRRDVAFVFQVVGSGNQSLGLTLRNDRSGRGTVLAKLGQVRFPVERVLRVTRTNSHVVDTFAPSFKAIDTVTGVRAFGSGLSSIRSLPVSPNLEWYRWQYSSAKNGPRRSCRGPERRQPYGQNTAEHS